MIREVSMFDKFSYCKNGVKCSSVHLKEVCPKRECDYRKCNKRHPRPCRFFRDNGFCKFGTSCRYSHRVPKEIEENNKKVESLEEVTKKLSKQVADQDAEIKALKLELCQIENVQLKGLRKQVDDLIKSNDEKERAIKKLEVDFNGFVNKCGLDKQDNGDQVEEDVELEERDTSIEKEKEINHPKFVQNALEFATDAYENIQDWGMEPELGVQILSKILSDEPIVSPQSGSKVYQKAVARVQSFSKYTEKTKVDKESCLLEITRFKEQLQTIRL